MNLGKFPVLKCSFMFMSFTLRCDSTHRVMPRTIWVHIFMAVDLRVSRHKSGDLQPTADTLLALEMKATKLL